MDDAARFWRHVRRTKGCWLWCGGKFTEGYGAVVFRGKVRGAHRVAYSLAIGPIPEGLCVCHRCDVKACVRPAHLFLGTRAANNRDMRAKGHQAVGARHGRRTMPERNARGEANGASKLTAAQVREIREAHSAGVRSGTLARRHNVSREHIWQVVRRHYWRHI